MRIAQDSIQKSGDFKTIEQWSSIGFSHWLLTGISDYFLIPTRKYDSFKPVDMYFQSHWELSDNISEIFDALSQTAKTSFSNGLAMAMKETTCIEIAKELIDIAVATKSEEANHAYADMLEKFADNTTEEARKFCTQTLIALSKMAGYGKTQDLVESLNRLANAPAFPYFLSGTLLVTLCHIAPKDIKAHIMLLKISLEKAYAIEEGVLGEKHNYQKILIDTLDKKGISYNELVDAGFPFTPSHPQTREWRSRTYPSNTTNPVNNRLRLIVQDKLSRLEKHSTRERLGNKTSDMSVWKRLITSSKVSLDTGGFEIALQQCIIVFYPKNDDYPLNKAMKGERIIPKSPFSERLIVTKPYKMSENDLFERKL